MTILYRLLVVTLLLANLYIGLSANTHAYNAAWMLMQILSATPGQDS